MSRALIGAGLAVIVLGVIGAAVFGNDGKKVVDLPPSTTTAPPATTASTTPPEIAPLPATAIVFTSFATGDGELYVLDTATGEQTQLTRAPGIDGVPSISHDRTQIAYLHRTSTGAFPELHVMFVDGSGDRSVSDSLAQDGRSSWSPDDSMLAYVDRQRGADSEIAVIPLAGGTPQLLTDNDVDDSDPAWSPDGATILFTSEQRPGDFEVWSAGATGTPAPALLIPDALDPSWSPDGSTIVITSDRANGSDFDLYLADADGTDVRRLLRFADSFEYDAQFSPDGAHVVFTTNKDHATSTQEVDVYVVNADGSDAHPVVAAPSFDGYPAW